MQTTLQKLTVEQGQHGHGMHHTSQLSDKSKITHKIWIVCMNFYDDTKPLYLETDASGVGL